jgi:two-component system, chemotaxis family, chemotaxis protein CheY
MAYDFKKVKILVVESSVPMFKLVKSVVNLFGVPESSIYSSFTVEEGFETFCRIKPDLIIVDWLQNPDRGIILTKTIRRKKDSPNIYVPIIMTAGSGHLQRVLKARDAGISEYLVKPFSAKSLADRISRVIEKPKPFAMSENYVGPDRRVRNESYTGEERRKTAKDFHLIG